MLPACRGAARDQGTRANARQSWVGIAKDGLPGVFVLATTRAPFHKRSTPRVPCPETHRAGGASPAVSVGSADKYRKGPSEVTLEVVDKWAMPEGPTRRL